MIRIFTGIDCLTHDAGYGFPESPARLERILGGFDSSWDVAEVPEHARLEQVLETVHDPGYLEIFRRAVKRGDGLLGSSDNPLTGETWKASASAASAALSAADWVAEGHGDAFAAIRPPGHHAESKVAMGFCYLNNAAAAVQHLIVNHGLERVAVYDFDVHHGNGTQEIFYERSDVLFASTHQWPFYPGTGAQRETGQGAGAGKTFNVPLAAGTGDREFLRALREAIVPALASHEPEAMVISAGFDAWRGDPLGGMQLSLEAFSEIGSELRDLANRVCGGRLVTVLEGGYDLEALSDLTKSYLR